MKVVFLVLNLRIIFGSLITCESDNFHNHRMEIEMTVLIFQSELSRLSERREWNRQASAYISIHERIIKLFPGKSRVLRHVTTSQYLNSRPHCFHRLPRNRQLKFSRTNKYLLAFNVLRISCTSCKYKFGDIVSLQHEPIVFSSQRLIFISS